MNTFTLGFLLAGATALMIGCAEPHATYIPVYPARAVREVQPPLQPAPQVVTPAPTVVAPAAPPAAVAEAIPVAPSSDHIWVPGYWAWNGTWVWISGRWLLKPYPTAHWTPGHWDRHGRRYFWIEGRWW